MKVLKNLINDIQISDILMHYRDGIEDEYMNRSHKNQIDKLIKYSNIHYCDIENKVLRGIVNSVISKEEKIYSIHFVRYKAGDSCEKHIDRSSYGTYIFLLSDGYIGGELMIDGVDCKAKKGDVVYFNGNIEYHAVNKVKRGIREVLVVWTGTRRENGVI